MRLLYDREKLWYGGTGLPDLLWWNKQQILEISLFYLLLFFSKTVGTSESLKEMMWIRCIAADGRKKKSKCKLVLGGLCYTLVCAHTANGQEKVNAGTVTPLYSPIHQNHHCARKCHYISLLLLFKGDHTHTHTNTLSHTHSHTVNTLKVMFLQAAWGQVNSVINQLPGWFCIVYYCWTHHSSALKASDPWRVPVCVTVMDIVITMPSLSLYLSFCSVACCTFTPRIP